MHTAGSEQFSLGTNVVLKLHSDEVFSNFLSEEGWYCPAILRPDVGRAFGTVTLSTIFCFLQEVTGEVFASDKQRVVLLEPGSKQTLKNLRLLKTEHIKVRTTGQCMLS